jgi:hypothetical protein
MSAAAPLQPLAAKPQPLSSSTHAGLLLQRKCACGSPTSSLTGECAECKSKKLLQTKLTIGASNDPLEQEADRVADQVLAAPANPAVSDAPPHIQRFAGQPTGQAATAPASVDHVLAVSGRPLGPALRQDMEQRFRYDFSRVRMHSGAPAEQSAREVNAHAYTSGHHIVFGAGRFAPETHEGRCLIAHELTHVVQQSEATGFRDGQSGNLGLSPISHPEAGRGAPGAPVHVQRQPVEGGGTEPAQESSWTDTVWSVLSTIGGGLLGEFNEDPGFAEIGVDLGVSLIPYLDQASDVRDVSAHLYYMTFRSGELERPMRWVGLAFTVIGLIPVIGSAIKGASKLLIGGGQSALAHADEVLRLARQFTGSVTSSIADFATDLQRAWPQIILDARARWDRKLADVQLLLNALPAAVRSQLSGLIEQVDAIERASQLHLGPAFDEINRVISPALQELVSLMAGPGLGRPAYAMSLRPDIGDFETLQGGTRSISDWLGQVGEETWFVDRVIEAGVARIARLERHHTVFVFVLRAIQARRAGRPAASVTGVGSEGFRQIVDELFPQQLVHLDKETHDFLGQYLNDVLDKMLEPKRMAERFAKAAAEKSDWKSLSGELSALLGQPVRKAEVLELIALLRGPVHEAALLRDEGFKIVNQEGVQGMMRRLQQVTESELIDIVEEAYQRVFSENPDMFSHDVIQQTFAAIDEVRRGL